MIATDSRPGFTARLETRYIDTTDMCVELFFQATSPKSDVSTVSVIIVTEDKFETTVISSLGDEPSMWNRLFAVLPKGINQVVIEGRRSSSGWSSLSVDDISILPCTVFGNVPVQLLVYAKVLATRL
jgi:hypothetical protein